jgi:CIC family chloride channel protein
VEEPAGVGPAGRRRSRSGLLLLALPQMYGVGYPVLYKAVAGSYPLWFLLVLAAGKILACSLTIGIGGSGGVFAPSLFIGVTSGMAFGEIAHNVIGPAAGQPALYAVVAMGAVFASAARAPLTSVASVVEMTGDFTLTLPVMLAVAIATATSRALSYGTIYTTKLLRRGYDVDRAAPWRSFGDLTAADAMRPFPQPLPVAGGPDGGGRATPGLAPLPGPVTCQTCPQAVPAGESLGRALRQLEADGRDGLPVVSGDRGQVQGWITDASVLHAVAREIGGGSPPQTARPQAAGAARPEPEAFPPPPPAPLPGYQVLEVTIQDSSPAAGKTLGTITWPPGCIPVSVLRNRKLQDPDPGITLAPGDRINLLARAPQHPGPPQPPELPASQQDGHPPDARPGEQAREQT